VAGHPSANPSNGAGHVDEVLGALGNSMIMFGVRTHRPRPRPGGGSAGTAFCLCGGASAAIVRPSAPKERSGRVGAESPGDPPVAVDSSPPTTIPHTALRWTYLGPGWGRWSSVAGQVNGAKLPKILPNLIRVAGRLAQVQSPLRRITTSADAGHSCPHLGVQVTTPLAPAPKAALRDGGSFSNARAHAAQ